VHKLIRSAIRYLMTFKNFREVIAARKNNSFPVKGILRNGKEILLKGHTHATVVSLLGRGKVIEVGEKLCLVYDGKRVELVGYENNGGVVQLFINDGYRYFDVKDKTVLDIGSNIADSPIYFVLRGAKKVIGFEASPINFQHSIENVKLNNMEDKIIMKNIAVGSTKNDLMIDDAEGGASFSPRQQSGSFRIESKTLDDILKEIQDDGLVLKLDCEGCEYEVLLTAEIATLRRFEQIYLEFHDKPEKIKNKLQEADFEVEFTKKPKEGRLNNKIVIIGELLAKRKTIPNNSRHPS